MRKKALKKLLKRADRLIDLLEMAAGGKDNRTDWKQIAFRWNRDSGLQPVAHPHRIELDDLLCMQRQKDEIVRNTAQFVAGRSANNVLLSGSRGTGKSSLIKGILNRFSDDGLRLIEVDKLALLQLPTLIDLLYDRPERFILYCDDLSFEADDASYKALKAVLDGSIAAPPDNILLYATSNRRHLLPEYKQENLDTTVVNGEIHHGEAVEEKISLSERFGLWLTFYPYNQQQYLQIVAHWLQRLGRPLDDDGRAEALRWALQRGSRSGRVAWQFARDWAGR